MAIIRYPGSKDKLADDIMRLFPSHVTSGTLFSAAQPFQYVEPFFGAGAIGLRLMRYLHPSCSVWLNDIDPGMYSLWTAVREQPRELCLQVQRFTPTVEAFYEFKRLDDEPTGDVVVDGFRKLALHRMSVSGFGYKSGGPIGGRNQEGKEYTVDCRWTAASIKKSIMLAHRQMRTFSGLRITNLDFRQVLAECGDESFVYLDPPYYEKGGQLYKHNMSDGDHAALADLLNGTPASWVLSYDDHPRIRELYSWCDFHEIEATYTNAIATTAKRPKNREVVIVPRVKELLASGSVTETQLTRLTSSGRKAAVVKVREG